MSLKLIGFSLTVFSLFITIFLGWYPNMNDYFKQLTLTIIWPTFVAIAAVLFFIAIEPLFRKTEMPTYVN